MKNRCNGFDAVFLPYQECDGFESRSVISQQGIEDGYSKQEELYGVFLIICLRVVCFFSCDITMKIRLSWSK